MKDRILQAELKGTKYIYDGETILNLRAKSMLEVKAISICDDVMTVNGVERLSSTGRYYNLVARDDAGTDHSTISISYIKGEGRGYRLDLPIKDGNCTYRFIAIIGGTEVELNPAFDKYIGIKRNEKNSYIVLSGYIISFCSRVITICPYNISNVRNIERKYSRGMAREKGLRWWLERRQKFRRKERLRKAPLRKTIAFISVRATDRLLGNMEQMYNAINAPKEFYAKLKLGNNPEFVREAEQLLYTSKVIVTDDYLGLLRMYDKKPGQSIIQLWHATGAGKCFGQDGTNLFPPTDALYHQTYDYVSVSAEGIRPYYARAFGIAEEVVVADGVPRTDQFFNDDYKRETIQRVYEIHPEFKDRRIMMYAPTFRDLPGVSRAQFNPQIDWEQLSKAIGEECIFVICPHPVMTETILTDNYDNIQEIRDVGTNDMMLVSDLLVTDYSSVIFEYSLLHKPMAFYCFDYDDYDRNFYMDFDRDLPGPLLRTQDELQEYLNQDVHELMDDYEKFYFKYMSACDGHSTERIVRKISEMLES